MSSELVVHPGLATVGPQRDAGAPEPSDVRSGILGLVHVADDPHPHPAPVGGQQGRGDAVVGDGEHGGVDAALCGLELGDQELGQGVVGAEPGPAGDGLPAWLRRAAHGPEHVLDPAQGLAVPGVVHGRGGGLEEPGLDLPALAFVQGLRLELGAERAPLAAAQVAVVGGGQQVREQFVGFHSGSIQRRVGSWRSQSLR